MKKPKILLFLCLCISPLTALPMQIKKQKKFIFNQENYWKTKISESGKLFIGIIWDKKNKITKSVHLVKLPEKTLYWDMNPGPKFIYYINCDPCDKYICFSCPGREDSFFQLWNIVTKKCILKEKFFSKVVLFGPSKRYIALLANQDKYFGEDYRGTEYHILVFDMIQKKYSAKYKNNCTQHFLDYPRKWLFFKIDDKKTKKKFDIIINMNSGKEFARLKFKTHSLLKSIDNWFKKKSIKILYILNFSKKNLPIQFVLLGGKKLQDNLYTAQKKKKLEDIRIVCQYPHTKINS